MAQIKQTSLVYLIRHPEMRRIFRFLIVGLFSLTVTILLYALFSRWVWPGGPRIIEYALVTMIVTWINYEANRRFTFRAGKRSLSNISRFITVAVIAFFLNNTLFWIGHIVLHIYDFFVIVGLTVIVAAFTFTSHRFFTFHKNPWRFLHRFRHPTVYSSDGG